MVFEARGRGCCRRFSRTAPDLLLRGQGSGANPLCYPNVLAMETAEPAGAYARTWPPPIKKRRLFTVAPSILAPQSAGRRQLKKARSADVGIFHAIGAGWWLEPTCLVR